MDTKPNETVVKIEDTVFIIEYETSNTSKETAYDKLKKLIITHSDINQLSA